MNRIVLIVVGLALVLGVVVYVGKKNGGPNPENPAMGTTEEATPSAGASGTPNGMTSGTSGEETGQAMAPGSAATPGATPIPGEMAKAIPGKTTGATPGTTVRGGQVGRSAPGTLNPGSPGGATGEATNGATGGATSGTKAPPGETVVSGGRVETPNAHSEEIHDGVDGDTGMVPHAGDDGNGAPVPKRKKAPTLAGVGSPRVWLVASDLKKLSSARKGAFEVGNADGSRATPWKNRVGAKSGDGVRARGSTTATFLKGLQTTKGSFDAVAFCAPGVAQCMNSAPSQIKFGLDINHPESWIAGPDHKGKSAKGGSSFTALFIAARGSKEANPLLENQNGEAGARVGPFLGWIGPDLVGSIHGLQGIVGLTSVALPSPWTPGLTPRIYTLRFDRKKSDLRLFLVSDKGSATQSQAIAKGDGPDNDQYAAIAIGSKNPGKAAVTYVFEAAAYSRALKDREICAIHKEWNRKYALKIPPAELKPCR
jgi:hypothetical protein